MWIEKLVGDLGDKKKWRAYKARAKALPPGYREAASGLERYLMYFGPNEDTKAFLSMVNDMVDLLEQGVAAGTPVRDLVGSDPIAFADLFMENYGGGSWVRKERDRLSKAIDKAEAEQGGAS